MAILELLTSDLSEISESVKDVSVYWIDSPPFVSAGYLIEINKSERCVIKLCYFPFAVAIILSIFVYVTYYRIL